MKICVLNSSGNVGKSLITRELFYSRLTDPLIIEVETVNKGSKEIGHLNVTQFKSGDDFTNLYLKLMEIENVIVDIGASNLANFWEQMSAFDGVVGLFDKFVIPTTSGDKEMTDTYKTIAFLRSQGIDDSKIDVVFNRVKSSVQNEFQILLSADFDFDKDLYVKESSLFKDLGLMKQTINDIYNEDLNFYKPLILSETDPREKLLLVKKDLSNRMAHTIKYNLDAVFKMITGQEVTDSAPKKAQKAKSNKEVHKEVKEASSEDISDISEDDEEL